MKSKQGFTLIELLVVIAIIGILSSIVLASLNSAREKGQDASASASVSSMRAQAEISFNDNDDYTEVCTAVDTLEAGALAANGNTVVCGDATGTWSAVVPLKGSTSGFCADHTGFAGKVPSATAQGAASCVQ